MYTFDKDGEFCVGTTTINSYFKIRVLDYEVSLPEIHSFGPLITPQSVKLAYIVNWIERGLSVEFENKEDEEKILFFLLEYNKYAKACNDNEGSVVLKIALVAQKWLMLDLKWKDNKSIKENTKINPFKKIDHVPNTSDINNKNKYNNKNVKAKFANRNKLSKHNDIDKQLNMHEYDIFAATPQEPDIIINQDMNDTSFKLDTD